MVTKSQQSVQPCIVEHITMACTSKLRLKSGLSPLLAFRFFHKVFNVSVPSFASVHKGKWDCEL